MHERMSFSAFLHSASSAPMSALMPCCWAICGRRELSTAPAHAAMQGVVLGLLHTSPRRWASRDGAVWGKLSRNACCRSGRSAGTYLAQGQRTMRGCHCRPELWVPHPWRCLRLWMGPGQPVLKLGVRGEDVSQPMGYKVPSNPAMLRFYDFMIYKVPSKPPILQF